MLVQAAVSGGSERKKSWGVTLLLRLMEHDPWGSKGGQNKQKGPVPRERRTTARRCCQHNMQWNKEQPKRGGAEVSELITLHLRHFWPGVFCSI